MAKTGIKPNQATKGKLISDGFNRQKLGASKPLSIRAFSKLKREAKLEAARVKAEQEAKQKAIDRARDRLIALGGLAGTNGTDGTSIPPEAAEEIAKLTAELATASPDASSDSDDAKAAYQMLQDMRWVYRNVHGREKLLSLVNSDDRQFVFMVKELMKIESSLMAAKIRKNEEPGGSGQQNFFVVLKGLEDEKRFLDVGKSDSTVDMKQITRAMNPEENSYEPEEEETSQRDAPEMLMRTVADDRVEEAEAAVEEPAESPKPVSPTEEW